MRAQRARPAGYLEGGRIVLAGNRRLIVAMNVGGLLVLVLSCAVLGPLASAVRPDLLSYEATFDSPAQALAELGAFAVGLLLTPVLVIALHEAVHGIGFWCFTRVRPGFGFKGWYAYATAPGWYFSRRQLLVVGLAPLLVLTLGGLAMAWLAPKPVAVLALFGIVINVAGTVGDGYLAVRMLRLPGSAVIEDQPDRLTWYLPADEVSPPAR